MGSLSGQFERVRDRFLRSFPRGPTFWLGTSLLAMIWGGDYVRAQSAPRAVLGTAEERETIKLYQENQLLTARTQAERLLAANPDSAIGHYVLGSVLREADGSLPRAMAHLGRARGVLEEAYGAQPPEGPLTELHREVLFANIGVAGELEEYDFETTLLEYYDKLYDPDLLGQRAWLELKRRHYDDARIWAKRAVGSADPWQQSLGKNALCAIESEARERAAAKQSCLDALTYARQRAQLAEQRKKPDPAGRGIAVHAFNAALAAQGFLAYDEAERLAREGAQERELTVANPWRFLTQLYLDQARVPEALGAAHQMLEWRMRLPAYLREQATAEADSALALLLLVVGEPKSAFGLASRALDRPDRRGLTSVRYEQSLAGHALLRRAARRTWAEQKAEQASARGFLAGAKELIRWLPDPIENAADEERIRGVMADEDCLLASLRPYVNGGMDPGPTWLVGDLIEILGPGVVKIMLARARQAERNLVPVIPLHDALAAELEAALGNTEQAVVWAEKAGRTLPKGEALLRARTAAVGARAAEREGLLAKALGFYAQAMQSDPGVFRRQGWGIPAVVKVGQGGEPAEAIAELLRHSPRLAASSAGFVVRVDSSASGTKICVLMPDGSKLSCTDVAPAQGENALGHAQRAIDAFHQNAFAMRVGLSATDLNSLDGSNTVADDKQRERLRGVLDELSQ